MKDSIRYNPENGALLTEPRSFNLMFKTYVGATEDETAITYLRPETAQSIFVQFKNVLDTARKKLPFGIAQIGKAFRNEINPRNFTFRSREFKPSRKIRASLICIFICDLRAAGKLARCGRWRKPAGSNLWLKLLKIKPHRQPK